MALGGWKTERMMRRYAAVTDPTAPSKKLSDAINLHFADCFAIWPDMVRWLGILFGTLRSTVRTHRELALENLALRQQLAVWKARQPRPRLTQTDRCQRRW
jgi:hypothetical protein